MRRDDHSSRRQKRTRGQRPRTISVSLSDRGQTTQDFAIGIGVFLLSVAFVFSYLPSLTTPFDSSVGGAEAAQADRIADRVLNNSSSSERPNEISKDKFGEYHDKEGYELIESLGIRGHSDDEITFDKVDIRIEVFDGESFEERTVETDDGDLLVAGDEYGGQSAASSARIVTLEEGEDGFELEEEYKDEGEHNSAYRLIVRVW